MLLASYSRGSQKCIKGHEMNSRGLTTIYVAHTNMSQESYRSKLVSDSQSDGHLDVSPWGEKSNLDPKNFIIIDKSGGVFGRIPVIEPFSYFSDHFNSAGLSIFNCNWSDIYDFTADENTDSVHVSLLEKCNEIEKLISTPKTALECELENSELKNDDDSIALLQPLMSIPLSFSSDNSVVPLTIGNKSQVSAFIQSNNLTTENHFNKSALITVFPHETAIQSAKLICDYLRKLNSSSLSAKTAKAYFHDVRDRVAKRGSRRRVAVDNIKIDERVSTDSSMDLLDVDGGESQSWQCQKFSYEVCITHQLQSSINTLSSDKDVVSASTCVKQKHSKVPLQKHE
uniref:Uncharacterized protein n=1 Tax=Trichobilharzia regenti TaxID=157069 RepID=A0AA85K7P3_TRIRE|nr:unnamed protein product [Trichobilharzia regenti]